VTDGPLDLLLLGSGGWIPTEHRETCCALLRRGPYALLIDAGTGVRRLVEDPRLLAGADRLDVVLTHFHLDHVIGLAYLPALGDRVERHVFGPGTLNYDASTAAICERLLGTPFAAGVDAVAADVHEIPGGDLELPGLTLTHRTQRRHPAPTLALRLDDQLAWCTDTAADPHTAPFAQGVELLAHEAWSTSSAPRDTDVHTTGRDAARIAADAGADRLVLIHINPLGDDEALEADARELADARVGRDMLALGASA
jgi:ribonuclease BN (tRNA processing enzyme)